MTVTNMAEVTGPYVAPAPPVDVEQLLRRVEIQQVQLETARQTAIRHYRAWDELGEYLTEMADRHSLCSVYDEAVDDWNRDHPDHRLPSRKVELDVEVRIRVTGTFRAGTDHQDLRIAVEHSLSDLVSELDSEYDADSYVDVR